MYYIYELVDPRTNEPRYVGMSSQPEVRYQQHLMPSCGSSEKIHWIQELRSIGSQPIMNIIEQVENDAAVDEREQYWITTYIAQGKPLTNVLHGIVPRDSIAPRPRARTRVNVASILTLYPNRKTELMVEQNLRQILPIEIEEKPIYHIGELIGDCPLSIEEIAHALQVPRKSIVAFCNGAPTGAHRIMLFLAFFSWYYACEFTLSNVEGITPKEQHPLMLWRLKR